MVKEGKSLQAISLIVKEDPKAITVLCFCLLLSSLIEALGIAAIFPLISIILETGANLPPSQLTEFINWLSSFGALYLSIFIVVCFLLRSLVLGFAMRIGANIVAGFSHKLRISFVQAMLGASIHFIQSKSLGKNLSILTSDSMAAGAAYMSAARVLSGFFQAVMYLLYAVWLSVAATGLSIISVLVLVILIKTTMDRARIAGVRTTKMIHDISRNMGETLRGAKEAKATAREQYLSSYIIEDSTHLREAHATALTVGQTLRNIYEPVMVASALFCLLLFKDIIGLEPGYILFILAVYYRLMNSINTLINDYQKFIGQEAALWSIKNGIQAATAEKEDLHLGKIAPPEESQDIVFRMVSMQYGEKTVFSDISFTIRARQFSVLKGQSGSGKTTSVDLICGLVKATSGDIFIGQNNLNEIDTHLWRQKIGYVDQFPFLFNGTIRDNVLLDLKDVSDDQVLKCLRLCHIDTFVSSLPGGLDFQLHEGGTNLSGGQRQRIAIARSVIRKPSYLILDEPTSALDHESAEMVLQTLSELSKSMSVIAISHSSAALKYADLVIDFDSF